MGFATLPYGVSPEAVEYIYEKLSVESDIVNHHFGDGVPWMEALEGEEFPEHILRDWNFRKDHIRTPHKTYVSVTPINRTHNGLASYNGAEGNLSMPSPWDHYTFGDEAVKTAYLNYCKRIIDFFKPDYFAMSIETNLLYKYSPDLWPQYLAFHEYIYEQLKVAYPDLPVFTTISGAPLLKGFLTDNDHVIQRLAAMQLLEMSDYYAISFYPPATVLQGAPWPLNTFDDLFSLSAKPVIIAETACAAQAFSESEHGAVVLGGDPVKQKLFVDALLAASDKWRAEFVIWLTLRDLDVPPASPSELINGYVLKDAGLYDEHGNPRPALNSWREWFNKRIEE